MYKTIREAAETPIESGQFWMLGQGEFINGYVFDDQGYILGDMELTDLAAFTDIEYVEADVYTLWGNQDGSNFEVEVVADADLLLLLVDER